MARTNLLLKVLRERNITPSQLAREIGLSKQAVDGYINGSEPKISNAYKIETALQTPIKMIFPPMFLMFYIEINFFRFIVNLYKSIIYEICNFNLIVIR